jgi:hypothetical protein
MQKPLSTKELVQRADSICLARNNQLAEIATSVDGIPGNPGPVRAISQRSLAALQRLRPPIKTSAQFAVFLQAVRSREKQRRILLARISTAPEGLARPVKRFNYFTAKADAVAARLGFAECPGF